MPVTLSQLVTLHTSETITCLHCGVTIQWTTYRLWDSDDDKFSGVVSKLKWHQENDKSCVREQKLKGLLDN